MILRVCINSSKQLRRSFHLVTADPDTHDMTVLVADRELENFLRFFHSKMASSIEDPEQGNSEVARSADPSTLKSFEDGREVLLSIKTHTNRDVYLGMQHCLFFQSLHESVRR